MTTAFLALIFAGNAQAGGIASGGGFVYMDDENPWFLENTRTVSYCLLQDETNFHIDPATASTRVRDALNTWQRGFAAAEYKIYSDEMLPYRAIRIATQHFIEEECRATTALRIQLGVLTDEQKTRYGLEPSRLVAVTVRETYDTVSLVGTGFIYVAADEGELKPTQTAMHETPWQVCDGCVLKGVLLHELGHVFGTPHDSVRIDGAFGFGLMDPQFPELVVQKQFIELGLRNGDLAHFFDDDTVAPVLGRKMDFQEITSSDSQRGKYLEIPSGKFGRLTLTEHGLNVEVGPTRTGPFVLHGTAPLRGGGFNYEMAVKVRLTPEQRVFTNVPDGWGNLGQVVSVRRKSKWNITAMYKTIDRNVERPVFLNGNGASFPWILGLIDGYIWPM